MNAIKNFKGIRHNFEEFDGSENPYLNAQYKIFRKRLVELYLTVGRVLSSEEKQAQYGSLLTIFSQIEKADNLFIKNTLRAVSDKKVQEIDISTLLLVNRLFTQACRMQVYAIKDLLLTQEQIYAFDRAIERDQFIETQKNDNMDLFHVSKTNNVL
jgi:phosphate:Na+ symporter